MASHHYTLDPTDHQLLEQIANAVAAATDQDFIECRRIPGWPFVWLLHPGLNDGLTVACASSIERLADAELVAVREDLWTPNTDHIMLTGAGKGAAARRTVHDAGRLWISVPAEGLAHSERDSGH